ncbi:interleukin-13 [Labeo rohita]|uniref:interleukin-13 n=1 Tax=Labeo rohita TaxID=84645 RepID=UPI0021E1F4AD|nr:interleukin-13 [Labeo rohita]
MLKTVLLLTFAVFASSATLESSLKTHNDKRLLGELVDELEKAVKSFPNVAKEDTIYLRNLEKKNCRDHKHEFFCQAEQELKNKVSGLSGAKFEHFRTDKRLMRNLEVYNKHHGKTCKSAEDDDEIPLHEFLPKILTCVKSTYSQAK